MKKILIALSFTVFLIIGGLFVYSINAPKNNPAPADINEKKKYDIPIKDNYYFGAENPQITIIEFSDFACSYCQKSYSTIRQIGFKYKDKVKIVYKDFPIKENSLDLALAARCAGEQNLFWPMHDKLFSKQGQFSKADLPNLAKEIGANSAIFQSCLDSKKYENLINDDFLLAQKLGLEGTPKFFVNGYLLPGGDLPIEAWDKIIEFFSTNK